MNGIPMCLVLVGSLAAASVDAASDPDLKAVVDGNTACALDLYGRLRANPGNLFFSPHSLSTALAMTYGGARGETEKQMAQALHFNLPQDRLHSSFAALDTVLHNVQKQGKVRLSIANSLWPQQDHPFRPEYLALCQRDYGVAITPVDYVAAADEARGKINAWVEDQTQKKITDLIVPGLLTPLTRLVLANAIYFKGSWASRFQAPLTQDEPFHLSADKVAAAPLMRQKGKFGCADFDDLQVLELPYAGGDLSMLVLLPHRVDGLAELEAKLTVETLAEWMKDLREREVEVLLPRFKTTSEFSLKDALTALGMRDAFDVLKADFSGMDGRHWLFISAAVHKAFVDVNEEGTEAAAATGVAIAMRSVQLHSEVFRADHPFLYLIRENHTGSVLFLGRLTDPRAKK